MQTRPTVRPVTGALPWLAVVLTGLVACSAPAGTAGDGHGGSGPDSGAAGDSGGTTDTGGDSGGTGDTGEEPLVYPHNVYLDRVVSWSPGTVGSARVGWADMVDSDGVPIDNGAALGGPTGRGWAASGGGNQTVGVNGSAVFAFEEGWAVVDEEGDDFVTFQANFSWTPTADDLTNELAHVAVSPDGERWYGPAGAAWDPNPAPGEANDGFVHAHVALLHGSNPTWANVTEPIQAEQLEDGRWVPVDGVVIPPNFSASDPWLGGTRFDLSGFVALDDGSPWPADGRARYLRITDDSAILDGQDYAPEWSLGAHINAAMGIHVVEE